MVANIERKVTKRGISYLFERQRRHACQPSHRATTATAATAATAATKATEKAHTAATAAATDTAHCTYATAPLTSDTVQKITHPAITTHTTTQTTTYSTIYITTYITTYITGRCAGCACAVCVSESLTRARVPLSHVAVHPARAATRREEGVQGQPPHRVGEDLNREVGSGVNRLMDGWEYGAMGK